MVSFVPKVVAESFVTFTNYPDSGSAVVNAKLILGREFGTFVGSPITTLGLSQSVLSRGILSLCQIFDQHFRQYVVRRFHIFSIVESF